MSKGNVNIDHQDLLTAQGAFVDDDDRDTYLSEYEQWLEDCYVKERRERARKREGKF